MKTRISIFFVLVAMVGIFAGCSNSIIQNGSQNGNQASIADLKSVLAPNTVIVAVACGLDHSLALTNDGRVFATGANGLGQLGLGSTTDSNTWIFTIDGAKAIACGNLHSLVLLNDGSVWGTGDNRFGQLATRGTTDCLIWKRSVTGGAVAIACGSFHSLCISDIGQVFATGENGSGQLGVGDNTDRTWWTTNPKTRPAVVIAVAGGYEHSACLDKTGHAWTTGDNSFGQLALGNTENTNKWTRTLNGENVKAIACGFRHTVCLDNTGYVWGAGYNYYGSLGVGDNVNHNLWTPCPSFP